MATTHESLPPIDGETLSRTVLAASHRSAEALDRMAGEIEELGRSCDTMVATVGAAAQRAGEGVAVAEGSVQRVSELDRALGEVREALTELDRVSEVVAEVQQRSQRIGSIVQQLNILSINASIEAGRAGDVGKGFAVVAQEMRELSRITGEVAREIYRTVDSAVEVVGHTRDESLRRMDAGRRSLDGLRGDLDGLSGRLSAIDGNLGSLGGQAHEVLDHVGAVTRSIKDRSEAAALETSQLIGELTGRRIVDVSVEDYARDRRGYAVIDVRRPREWNDELGHLPEASLHTLGPALDDHLRTLDRGLAALFVCRSGGRSARAARRAQELGFEHVHNLVGGMKAWVAAGLPSARDEGVVH